MWRAKSSGNRRSALSSGCVAPGARSQKHLSDRMNQTPLGEHVEVAPARRARTRCPRAARPTHCSPSRHGVHQPHDSWAKNCIMLSVMPTGQVWSSRRTSVPVPRRLLDLVHGGEVRAATSSCSRGDERGGGAARADGAQRVPGQHAAGVHLDELAHRRAHRAARRSPGLATRPATPKILVPPSSRDARGPSTSPAPCRTMRGHGHVGLDVVDDGRPGEEARAGHVRRAGARVGALALERVEHRRRLAADVAADAHVQVDVEAEARSRACPCRGSRARGLRRCACSSAATEPSYCWRRKM